MDCDRHAICDRKMWHEPGWSSNAATRRIAVVNFALLAQACAQTSRHRRRHYCRCPNNSTRQPAAYRPRGSLTSPTMARDSDEVWPDFKERQGISRFLERAHADLWEPLSARGAGGPG